MSLSRLRRMPPAEIACRLRQAGFKGLERAGLARAAPRLELSVHPDPARFFPGAVDPEAARVFDQQFPARRDVILREAEDVIRGRLKVFGYGTLAYGDPIDWHLDPIADVRSPLVHWSRLDVLDRVQVGDSKLPWEVSRHQWLVGLGQAYRLTADDRYAEAFAAQLRSWRASNPRGLGINWASSLEVSLRLISWLWALWLFGDAPAMTEALVLELLQGVTEHAAHVERYLSHYYAPNTHLTGEALGLLYAATVLPQARATGRWRRRAIDILEAEATRQILPDGTYCEHSTAYGRYTAEIYLHALILARRAGLTLSAELSTRIQSLLDNLLWSMAPDGSMPMIGDADGGWLLPLADRRADDPRGIFSTAAAVFGRSDYAAAAGGEPAPETLWLLGEEGVRAVARLEPRAPAPPPSRLFAAGGLAVLRSGWQRDAHQLLFDVSELCAFGHAHADLLSVQCVAFGQPYLVDPGTYCYTAEPEWRDYFRGSSAHSTLIVDEHEQARPNGPFHWRERPVARLRGWRTDALSDLADAEHYAYSGLADPVVHRRRVLFVKPRYWIIVDDLLGRESHTADLRFQFGPLPVRIRSDGWATAEGAGKQGLRIRALCSVPLTPELREGAVDPPAGWFSPDYGMKVPAPVLRFSTRARLPLRIVTVLLPTADRQAAPPELNHAVDPHGAVCALSLEGEQVIVTDEDVYLAPSVALARACAE